jgi:hypothetical protein
MFCEVGFAVLNFFFTLSNIAVTVTGLMATSSLCGANTLKSWVAEWKTMFMTSTTTAKYMVGRFVKAIEEFGRTELWNKRCKFTVDWEKENGITSADKKAKAGSGGRKSFSSHPPRGPENSESADQRILQSYLREVDLIVMDRLDSCKFLMTVDTG